ncbi:hypothetical protein HBO32_07525 [Pseudomonas nitroreducens]|uniref:hypothetical protein n=1 Tax=Pseudomonas TaxID=286 RepID=UPI0007EE7D64|nr:MULTISPECIES: hypothetical protein [Pseudomonas]NMZ72944.1 hypothetical protein [Pseudomonas nitroreducens]OBY59435.1 hypothetical protein A9513_028965 [Pseudomonas sp. AU12215]
MNTQLNQLQRLLVEIDSIMSSAEAQMLVRDIRKDLKLGRNVAAKAIRLLQERPSLPVELVGITAQLEEGNGFWHSCSGCYETEDGHPVGQYPHSSTMKCPLGSGCSECGGLGAVWDNNDYTPACETCLDAGRIEYDPETGEHTFAPCPDCPCEQDDDPAANAQEAKGNA